MKIYSLLLEDGTIGKTIAKEISVGDYAQVQLADENGNMIQAMGTVADIIEEKELWQ